MKNLLKTALLALAIVFAGGSAAHADTHRLSLGLGVAHLNNPSTTTFEISGEYEYRFHPLFGAGLLGNYFFTDPYIALVGTPLFVHPLAGDWVVLAAPLVQFGSAISTQVGARLGTRVPIPLGALTITPSFAMDFIGGGVDYLYGLGVGLGI